MKPTTLSARARRTNDDGTENEADEVTPASSQVVTPGPAGRAQWRHDDPTDPARCVNADLRLAAIDMDGTLLDDDKNFPPGMDELLDLMDERSDHLRARVRAPIEPSSTIFPSRPARAVISESSGINHARRRRGLLQPVTTPPPCARSSAWSARPRRARTGSTVWSCAANGFADRAHRRPLRRGMLYHRTRCVEGQENHRRHRGGADPADRDRQAGGRHRPGRRARGGDAGALRRHPQYAISGWADLQMRIVDKGNWRARLRFLGADRSQTAVFGDAGNDMSMMSEGDLSFTMANLAGHHRAARFIQRLPITRPGFALRPLSLGRYMPQVSLFDNLNS